MKFSADQIRLFFLLSEMSFGGNAYFPGSVDRFCKYGMPQSLPMSRSYCLRFSELRLFTGILFLQPA